MPCNISTIPEFDKNIKKLSKKYRNLKLDLQSLISELLKNPKIGTPLADSCYKIRVANSSVPTGKSKGFRVITYHIDKESNLYLLTIYSKSDQDSISDNNIVELLNSIKKN